MNLAPIALFAYRRPEHLKRVITSLLENPETEKTDLIIFSDGPKKIEHVEQVAKVREMAQKITGFHSVRIVERTENLGLANSIIQGVTSVIDKYGSIIVIEDDLVLSKCFLKFMNSGLERYRTHFQVASIHGYCYPLDIDAPDAFFIRGADCWGWATWKRAWDQFEPNGDLLLQRLKEQRLLKSFDYDGAYSYTKMLQDQIQGRNDSWAVRWHASMFLREMVTLYPGCSLVSNIGIDGSGTHSGKTNQFDVIPAEVQPAVWPDQCVENPVMRNAFIRYFQSTHRNRSGIWRFMDWVLRLEFGRKHKGDRYE